MVFFGGKDSGMLCRKNPDGGGNTGKMVVSAAAVRDLGRREIKEKEKKCENRHRKTSSGVRSWERWLLKREFEGCCWKRGWFRRS